MAIQDAIHGSVPLPIGQASVDVILSGDDVIVPGNTIFTWNNEDGTASPVSNLVTGEIVSGTILRFSLAANAVRELNIQYHLAEHDSSVEVQNLTEVDVQDGDASADFVEVVLANSFINPLGVENVGGTWGDDDRIRCEFDVVTKKNIDFANGSATGGADTWHAQVVESTDFDVAYFEALAFTEAGLTKDIDITSAGLSAVTDAFACWTIEGPDAEQIKHAFQIGEIKTITNFLLTRDDAGTDHENSVSVFIVEPGAGVTIQHVAGQIDAGNQTATPTITAVDTEKAQLFHGSPDGRGWGAVDRADDDFITCAHFTKFTTEGPSVTSITVTRNSTTNACVFRFSVVEWGAVAAGQTLDAQLLSGGSVLAPGLLSGLLPQLLSGGSVLDPGLLAEVLPQLLNGGSVLAPSILPEVHPQRLSGGSTLEPVLSLGLTVNPQRLSGGSVLDPSLQSEVRPQRLSGGSTKAPTLLIEVHPQLLSGGSVLSPELLAEIHPQLISGGAVLLPTVAVDQLLLAQLLSGGSVLDPSLLAELSPQLLSGGTTLDPTFASVIAAPLLSGGSVLLPTIGAQLFLNIGAPLSGGQVRLPELLIFVTGNFQQWIIPGAQRQWIVRDANRIWIID